MPIAFIVRCLSPHVWQNILGTPRLSTSLAAGKFVWQVQRWQLPTPIPPSHIVPVEGSLHVGPLDSRIHESAQEVLGLGSKFQEIVRLLCFGCQESTPHWGDVFSGSQDARFYAQNVFWGCREASVHASSTCSGSQNWRFHPHRIKRMMSCVPTIHIIHG